MFTKNNRLFGVAVGFAATIPLGAMAQGNSANAPGQNKVEVINSVHHDHDFVLANTVGKAIDPTFRKEAKEKKRVPYVDSPDFDHDTAAQLGHTNTLAAPTTTGLGFDGMGDRKSVV